MKFENNWKQKTLEALENSIWEKPEFDSHLVITCHELRKKQLKYFTIEDLRIMIGQNISLQFLIPLAIEELNKNILAGGHFYEGDLLNSVLTSELNYWQKNKANWTIICNLYIKNESKIEEYCYQNDYKNNWLKEFENFKKLN
tara:strand:- start:63 stop:491 length:429 start_codon:yes stop_codon:yes gene_type:complete